jgi:uncharacterized membrane protein
MAQAGAGHPGRVDIPAAVRFSGISFSYNLAYAIFGGLTPIMVTLMLKNYPLAPAYYVIALCALGVVIALVMKERTDQA